jgi:phosphoglucosamine mutase
VRGIAGTELNGRLAYELGRAGAFALTDNAHRPRILVGRDTRISGQMLESALVAGVCAVGAVAVPVGVMPTPAVAWLTRAYGADAGVVISASHNSMEYNGIKFFDRDGYKLPDGVEDRIEALVAGEEPLPSPTGAAVGRIEPAERAEEDYARYVESLARTDLNGMRIVLDCANGASYRIAPRIFAALGADIVSVFDQPNGRNINDNCGSTHMAALAGIVPDMNADIGLAFDGDADRCLAVDETGQIVDGDQIMLICADRMRRAGRLNRDTLVVTVMSNFGLSLAAREMGIRLEKTAVGDRYVLECMRRHGYSLGGEQSGHIIFLGENTTGDGMVTALNLCMAMRESGKRLSELASVMTALPQVLINVRVAAERMHEWKQDPQISRLIALTEEKWIDSGRVLVRESGTEPLIRVMMEGGDQQAIEADARAIADLIAARLS